MNLMLATAASTLLLVFSLQPVQASNSSKNKDTESCQTILAEGSTVSKRRVWTLEDFFAPGEDNLAVQHPFTIANAAEKAYAMITHVPGRDALDPLYRMTPVKVYPMLNGEHPASEGRMVVGQEKALEAFVSFVHSSARGDRSGKTVGFPGPAGTGKTELLYVLANLEKNLGVEPQYKQYSYRWKNLTEIPYFLPMFKKTADGKFVSTTLDPDLPRSPFTLLRRDMQAEVLKSVIPQIREKWGMTLSKGWGYPEPKSEEILRKIFEHEHPEIAEGAMEISDLTKEEYLKTLSKYLTIVPKTTLRPVQPEPGLIRAQTDTPNYTALFAAPNIARAQIYGQKNSLAVDYNGKIFQQDGGLLMFDELYRNPGEFLNILLEIIQNHVAETDYGKAVTLDVIPIWNSNDESIELAAENNAIKALINRTDSPAMRSLMPPRQIEAVMLFQVGLDRFKVRKLDETELRPLVHSEIYPPVTAEGKTVGAHGRYALYYEMGDEEILIAPYALDYISWIATSSRVVTDLKNLKSYANELNLVRANGSLLTDPVERLKVILGEKIPERADLMELSRVHNVAKEGAGGISARDIETWLKKSLEIAYNSGKKVLTPRMVDKAFQVLIDEGRIKPPSDTIRSQWQQVRKSVKEQFLLAKMSDEIKAIVSGDGQKAERMYDSVERELITLANDSTALEVITDDGGQRVLINTERLREINQIYLEKFHRPFQPNFLLRTLQGARTGQAQRNPELLEAIRIFISRHEAATADYITAFDSYFRSENSDPGIQRRASEVLPVLASYGYSLEAFQEAVAFVAQLHKEEQLERAKSR